MNYLFLAVIGFVLGYAFGKYSQFLSQKKARKEQERLFGVYYREQCQKGIGVPQNFSNSTDKDQ